MLEALAKNDDEHNLAKEFDAELSASEFVCEDFFDLRDFIFVGWPTGFGEISWFLFS